MTANKEKTGPTKSHREAEFYRSRTSTCSNGPQPCNIFKNPRALEASATAADETRVTKDSFTIVSKAG